MVLKSVPSRQSGWTVATFASVGVHLAAGLGMYLAPTIGMADGSSTPGLENGFAGGVIQLTPLGSQPVADLPAASPSPATNQVPPPPPAHPVVAAMAQPELVPVPNLVPKPEPEPAEVALGKDDGVKDLKQWIASDKTGENRALPGPEEQPGLSRRAGVPKRASGDPNASPNAGAGATDGAGGTAGGTAAGGPQAAPSDDKSPAQTPPVSAAGASERPDARTSPEEAAKPVPAPPNPSPDRASEPGEPAGSPRPESPSAAAARALAPQSAPEVPKPSATAVGPRAVEVDANRPMVPDAVVPPRPSVPVGPERQGDTPDGKVVLPADVKPAAKSERSDRAELPIADNAFPGENPNGRRQADAPREPSMVSAEDTAGAKPIEARMPRTKAEFDLLLPEAVKLVRRSGSPPLILSPDLLEAATAAARQAPPARSVDPARAAQTAAQTGQAGTGATGSQGNPGSAGSPGSPGNPGKPGEAGDNGGNVVGDPGLQSDRDSDAFSVKVGEYRAGKVEAGDGIEIRTVRPEFGLMARTLAFPSPPKVEVIFGRDGEVKRARILRSSGYSVDVDEPILNAVYQWRAGGRALKDLPDKPSAELRLNLTVFLR